MFNKDDNDPLRVRRNLAMWSAIFSLIIWPHELLFMHIFFDVTPDLIKGLLTYIATLAGTSIGAYLWACNKGK